MEPRGEAFASRTVRGLNFAATRGVPNKRGREDSVSSTSSIPSPPPPRIEGHTPHHPAGGYNTTAVVAAAIAGVGGGEIELDTRNLQADIRCTSSPRTSCLRPCIMALDFSNNDEEIISTWIWRSSRMARLGNVSSSNGAL